MSTGALDNELCKECGQEIPLRRRRYNAKFCSKICCQAWNIANPAKQKLPNVCIVCGNEIPDARRGKNAKYCSKECLLRYQSQGYHDKNISSHLPAGTVGAISEYRAVSDLLQKGFEVFRAVSPCCSCDLAILKNGILLRIEVRTGHYDTHGKPIKSAVNQKHKADILALILPNEIQYIPELPVGGMNGYIAPSSLALP